MARPISRTVSTFDAGNIVGMIQDRALLQRSRVVVLARDELENERAWTHSGYRNPLTRLVGLPDVP